MSIREGESSEEFNLEKELEKFNKRVTEINGLMYKELLGKTFLESQVLKMVTDPDGRIVTVNPIWKQHFGFSENEMAGRYFIDFVYKDDIESTMQAFAEIVEQQEVKLYFINRYINNRGEPIRLMWWGIFITDDRYAFAEAINLDQVMLELGVRESNS